MYTAYFGLNEPPFAVTPDPGFLYLSPYHREALAHLLYGTEEHGGFVQLTGEVGTGKTTLIRSLVEHPIDAVDIALCLNPCLTVLDLVALVLTELGVEFDGENNNLKQLIDRLNKHLLDSYARGRRTVLIIDEAQNLNRDVLEQIRLLTNLETHRDKLLRIILVGQPELRTQLGEPELRQLAQRITARYHLQALGRNETKAYVRHRLQIAGAQGDLFSPAALTAVFRWSRGIPRLINTVCDRALLGVFVSGGRGVTRKVLNRAAREALHGEFARSPRHHAAPVLGASLALAGALLPASLEQIGLAPGPQLLSMQEPTTISAPPAATRADSLHKTKNSLPASAPPLGAWLAGDLVKDDAMSRLLALWGEQLTFEPGVYPCERLSSLQLRCVSGEGDWELLRRYNRPVILRLVNANGHARRVLLRSLSGAQAVLDLGDRPVVVKVAELDRLWTGEYLLTWRPPTESRLIGPGSRGEPVLWLRRQLARAQDTAVSEPLSDIFDAGLKAAVEQFQRRYNLEVDGLVGLQTMLLLSSLAPIAGEPLLIAPTDSA